MAGKTRPVLITGCSSGIGYGLPRVPGRTRPAVS